MLRLKRFTHFTVILIICMVISMTADGVTYQRAVLASTDSVSQVPANHQPNARRASKRANGITVLEPKIFDEHTLTERLAVIHRSLSSIPVIDSEEIRKAIGAISGTSADTSSVNVGLTFPTIPSDDTNATTPSSTSGGSNTANQTSITPYSDALGRSANEVLAKYMELNYERIGLELMLERAYSDRVITLKDNNVDYVLL